MMSLHSALRAQLGVAVPAMSIPKEANLDQEPCLLFFGIVDFLQVCASCAIAALHQSCSALPSCSALGGPISKYNW